MKTIKEAPKYQVNDKGQVSNIKTGKVVKEEKNYVRLSTENGRIRLNTKELIFKYFKNSEVEKESEKVNNKQKSGAQLIRDYYDANSDNFNIKQAVKDLDINYGRVWGCIKKYKLKLMKNDN